MKKLLCLIFLFVTILVSFSLVASAEIVAWGDCGDNLTYTLDDEGTLTISGTGHMYDNYNWNFSKPDVKKAIINDDVTGIGHSAFQNFVNMMEVVIPNTMFYIADYAFSDCSALESVSLPESVGFWGHSIFSGCSSLKRIDIPYGTMQIYGFDFKGCTALEYVSIPKTVSEIYFYNPSGDVRNGLSPFFSCPNIKEINVDENNPYFTSIDGILYELYDNDIYGLIKYPPKKVNTEFTVPKNMQYIAPDAFSYCQNLINIYVEEGDDNNFSSIDGVLVSDESLAQYPLGRNSESYTVPNGIKRIDCPAFANETDLKKIVLPETLEEISSFVFYGCTNLNEINLPEKVTYIGQEVFYNTALYNNSANWVGGVLFIDDCLIKADVTAIPDKYTIPDNTRMIAVQAFTLCENLKTISLPNGLKELTRNAFMWCSSLESISIPKTLTSIYSHAFYECSNLSYVYYEGTEEDWNNVYINQYGNEKFLNATVIFEVSAIFDIPDEFTISNFENTINGTSFDLALSNGSDSITGDVYVALYDDDEQFIDVTPYSAGSEINISIQNAGVRYIKVMWWSKNGITPFSSSALITLW